MRNLDCHVRKGAGKDKGKSSRCCSIHPCSALLCLPTNMSLPSAYKSHTHTHTSHTQLPVSADCCTAGQTSRQKGAVGRTTQLCVCVTCVRACVRTKCPTAARASQGQTASGFLGGSCVPCSCGPVIQQNVRRRRPLQASVLVARAQLPQSTHLGSSLGVSSCGRGRHYALR